MAVVSGRPVGFLRAVLDVPGVVLVGQYGLERLAGSEIVVDPRITPFSGAVAAAADRAEREMPALLVERKGEVAVTLHWRGAPEAEAEARALGLELASAHGLVAQAGRRSLELRPPVDVDKGTAVRALAAGFDVIVVAGDDRGDLAGFSALDDLRAEGTLQEAVRVAVGSDEAPEELIRAADLVVDGPAGFAALLGDLAAALGPGEPVG